MEQHCKAELRPPSASILPPRPPGSRAPSRKRGGLDRGPHSGEARGHGGKWQEAVAILPLQTFAPNSIRAGRLGGGTGRPGEPHAISGRKG